MEMGDDNIQKIEWNNTWEKLDKSAESKQGNGREIVWEKLSLLIYQFAHIIVQLTYI